MWRLCFLFLATPALAQQESCADRQRLIVGLASKHGEQLRGGRVQNPQQIIEVWVSQENGTWTVLLTRTNGRSCIMASGTNWREFPSEPEGEDG